jgi:hypothetical protein
MIPLCSAWRDALNGAETLTLELTVSAHYETHNSATGGSLIKDWPEATFSREWTRANPTPFALNNETPDAGEFWLATKCCCWTCRWSVRVAGEGWGDLADDGSWEMSWTSEDIAVAGDPPTTDSGTDDVEATARVIYPEDTGRFCQADDEPGRTEGMAIRLGASGIDLSSFFGGTVTYTDSSGGSASGTVTSSAVSLPGAASPAIPAEFALASCEEVPEAWAQSVFAKTTDDGTISESFAASYRVTLRMA